MEKLNCIINNKTIKALANPNIVVLDFLRQYEHLNGTKEGCSEGDCGACTILVGELRGNEVVYKSVNSCLMPLGDVHGKHIVTIEGVNHPKELTPIQHAFVEEGGTQCGFCTPGFIMSLTGYCINHSEKKVEDAINSVDGNICRCTGHPPIIRAIRSVVENLEKHPHNDGVPLAHLIEQKILPEYFFSIAERLKEIQTHTRADVLVEESTTYIVSGGTDLYVQKAFTMHTEITQRISAWRRDVPISEDKNEIQIPSTTTVEEFRLSPVIEKYFPELKAQLKLFGSTPIRNRATIAGNLANASPIGDMTSLLLAMNATLILREGSSARTLPLRKFYTGYKQLDKKKTELIETIFFSKPKPTTKLNFEKISRRQHLDIASVNSTMVFDLKDGILSNVGISAGGVGATPLYLEKTSQYLNGKTINADILNEAFAIAHTEISPISDARGSAHYKRLLLRQLIATHIMKFFPDVVRKELIILE